MPRNYAKRRADDEPRPDKSVTTHLTTGELAEVDRRADAVGFSRSAFLRAVLLAGGDTCNLLRERIAELDAQVAYHSDRAASLEAQVMAAHELRTREVDALRGRLYGMTAWEAEQHRLEQWYMSAGHARPDGLG